MEPDKEAELNFQGKLEQYKQVLETQRVLIKSVANFGINALRGIFLLNGGGAVAVLAHINALEGTGKTESVKYFAIGALCAVLASGSAYVSELLCSWHYARAGKAIIENRQDDSCASKLLRYTGLSFLVIAVMLFVISCSLFLAQVVSIGQNTSHAQANTTIIQGHATIIQNNATIIQSK